MKTTQICYICKQELLIVEFYKGNYKCKGCASEYAKTHRKEINTYYRKRRAEDPEYRERDKQRKEKYRCSEEGRTKEEEYRRTHKEEIDRRSKEHYTNNKDRKKELGKLWKKNNPDKYKELVRKQNQKKRQDPIGNLSNRLRLSMRKAYRKGGVSKTGRTFSLLGYTPKQLYNHLSVFYTQPCQRCGSDIDSLNAHMDHILPIGTAKTEEDIIRLNQLGNLRMICSVCNLKKISEDLKVIGEAKCPSFP